MKFVYVLVSDENDYYTEEFVVSAYSLRKHNPDADIWLIVDELTNAVLNNYRDILDEIGINVITEAVNGEISKKQRSRLLKTSIRNLIDGSFLYLDSDTIIASELAESDFADITVGMVLDHHLMFDEHCRRKYMEYNSRKTGFRTDYENKHFNGGVIYSKNNERAREFWNNWHDLYKISVTKGVDFDQTSLNEANCVCNGIIDELNGTWNVQVNSGLSFISDAKIIHYLGYQPKNKDSKYFTNLPFDLCDSSHFEDMKRTHTFSADVLRIIDNPKSSFKKVIIIPNDSIGYDLLFSNHFRVLKFKYVKFKVFFAVMEKIYQFMFVRIYKRP